MYFIREYQYHLVLREFPFLLKRLIQFIWNIASILNLHFFGWRRKYFKYKSIFFNFDSFVRCCFLNYNIRYAFGIYLFLIYKISYLVIKTFELLDCRFLIIVLLVYLFIYLIISNNYYELILLLFTGKFYACRFYFNKVKK